MPHPGCKIKKVVHILDEQIPEWQLFEAVQPIFTASLQWRIGRQYGPAVDNDAQTIESENTLDFFKHEMERLPDTAPETDLSCEVFDNCIDTLSDLLKLLDRLVQDRVLSATHGLETSSEAMTNASSSDCPTEEAPVNLPAATAVINHIYIWLGIASPPPKHPPPQPPTDMASSTAPSNLLKNPSTKNHHRYPKLQALGKVVTATFQDGADILESCAAYLNLEQTADEYIEGVNILSSFNTCLESSDVCGGFNQLDFSYPLDIPRTQWKDVEPSTFSNRLLGVLHKKVTGCPSGQEKHHQAMLRLNGFQLEDRPLVFDVFFLTCRHPNYWQESRFMSRTNQLGTQKSAPRPEFVHNLCDHIDRYRQGKSNPTVLNISFDERRLFATTADLLAHSGAPPAMSLEDLLRRGFFRKPTAGGMFSPGDKAVLTLSLARCLLHLFQSPWMRQPWTAESVQFLHKSRPIEILDVHHPYVRYILPRNDDDETTEPELAKYRKVMLSFARLLLEIDTGDTITASNTLSGDPDDLGYALSDILDCRDEPRGPYHQAIEGCLKFKFLLASMQKREPKANPDYQIRKVIYTGVIEHLEQNLSRFRNHRNLLVRRNLRMEDCSTKPAQSTTEYYIPAKSRNSSPHRGPPTQQRLPPTFKASDRARPLIPSMQFPQPRADATQLQHTPLRDESPVVRTEYGVANNGNSSRHSCPSKRHEFEVGIICALQLEHDAVALMFDQFWDEEGDLYGKAAGDQNTYTTGRIGKFNVVLVLLSGMGKASAASAAASFRSSYAGVQLTLLVGICGGMPTDNKGEEILLGDVIISECVVQYDLGRRYPSGFKRKDSPQESLGRANANIRSFIATLQTQLHVERLQAGTARHLVTLQQKSEFGKFTHPGTTEDKLFEPSYRHKHSISFDCDICNRCIQTSDLVCEEALKSSCSELRCDEARLVLRERLEPNKGANHLKQAEAQMPIIHFGSIASGDTVMKSGEHRDTIAEREDVIGFEMEAAGIWDNLSCIVIKGVCDYADSHKNKRWQNFAAATAASAMKALLDRYHKRIDEVS
ncbi:hypothetical protein TWF694_005360 [Orbilia ellipsospora]|uniref:Nucleoside phosphorylase domain-containing protein n=1 Tax=Orbilia ellipsospora TaxID=2528407 RepID=A0AAV9WV19_9PEZI